MSRKETPWSPHDGPLFGDYVRDVAFTNWRPRGTGDWLLIYTRGGSGRITSDSGAFSTAPGDAILYAPGEAQDYRTDSGTRHWWLLWSHFVAPPDWMPWLRWPQGREGVRRLRLDGRDLRARFVTALTRALRFSRGNLPVDFAVNALEEALLWAGVAGTDESHGRRDPRIRKGMDYLAGRLREPFRLETVARHCGLSVSRFAHLFKETAGLSPQKFFEQQRLRQAGELLGLSSLGIAEVAAEVGYDDPFYFSNRFRRQMGKSPSQWRRDRSQKPSGEKQKRPAA